MNGSTKMKTVASCEVHNGGACRSAAATSPSPPPSPQPRTVTVAARRLRTTSGRQAASRDRSIFHRRRRRYPSACVEETPKMGNSAIPRDVSSATLGFLGVCLPTRRLGETGIIIRQAVVHSGQSDAQRPHPGRARHRVWAGRGEAELCICPQLPHLCCFCFSFIAAERELLSPRPEPGLLPLPLPSPLAPLPAALLICARVWPAYSPPALPSATPTALLICARV